jgi:carbonic anhydrase
MRSTRLDFLAAASAALLVPGTAAAATVAGDPDTVEPVGIDEGLRRLRAGNARFVAGRLENPRRSPARRSAVAPKQEPFASIVACADSRVSPETVFDQGLGDLFVSRSAGNTADAVTLGSLEYATLHFATPLIVVVGHTGCGAIEATLAAIDDPHADVPGSIPAVVAAIRPSVSAIPKGAGRMNAAVAANARAVAKRIGASDVLEERIARRTVRIVAARLDLATGAITWL